MSQPQVSVIIPCYNYAAFLPDAVGSVRAQSFTGWELLIVDDGSTDGTCAVAQSLRASVPLRLIRQSNAGPAAARNTGARHAHAPLLLFLDADDMLPPDALRLMVAALRAHPDAAFVSGAMQVFGSDALYWPGLPVDLATLMLDNTVLPAALVQKDIWSAAGGFDEALRLGEDWDFWLRVVAAGGRGLVLRETLLYYRRHGPSLMSHARQDGWSVRAHIIGKHPALYGPALVRWAERRLATHPLPVLAAPCGVEEMGQPHHHTLPAVQLPVLAGPPAGTTPGGLRRLMRLIPPRWRFRAKQWIRRIQLRACV